MLGYLFEKTTALVKETVNVVTATTEYVVDEITSIPEAIEKGWDEGLFSKEDTPSDTTPSNNGGNSENHN